MCTSIVTDVIDEMNDLKEMNFVNPTTNAFITKE